MKPVSVQAHSLSAPPAWLRDDGITPGIPIFAGRRWLRSLEVHFGFQAEVLAGAAAGGVEAAVPLLSRQRFFLRTSPPPPITLYNGFVSSVTGAVAGGDAGLRAAAAAILDRIVARYHFVALALPIGCAVTDVFRKKRWQLILQQTIRVPMPDYDTVWKNYSQSLRRKIRRADDHRLRLVETRDVTNVTSLYGLSYERHAMVPPIPVSVVRDWLGSLCEQGIARVFSAVLPNGTVVAARAIIPDGDVVYDWLAGADVATADISASHWLVANIQRQCVEEGYGTFDFMGANTPGIVDFKRSFGGERIPYHIATYYRSSVIKTMETLRNTIKRRNRSIR